MQINLLVFHRAPQALNDHIVPPCAFAVHADRDLFAQQDAGEGDAGKLTALDALLFVKQPAEADSLHAAAV